MANAENAAGGSGLTPPIYHELLAAGIDGITLGDHVYKRREIIPVLQSEPRIVRPANYPAEAPGREMVIVRTAANQVRVAVFALLGRVFMPPVDCPFQAADRVLAALPADVRVILLDFHAEATSDKQLMGRHLDGRVTAVLGTHTHVPTADEQILPGGTAFQCDVGMTGPHESILGRRIDRVLETTLTHRPTHFEVADKDVRLNGTLVDLDPQTGRAMRHSPHRRYRGRGSGWRKHLARIICLHKSLLQRALRIAILPPDELTSRERTRQASSQTDARGPANRAGRAGLGAAGIAGHGRNPHARCAGTRHAPATRFAALHVLFDLSAALPGLRHDNVVGLAAARRDRTCPGGQRGRHAPGGPEPGRRGVVVGFRVSRTMARRHAQRVDHGRHRGDGRPGDRRAMGVAIVDVLESSRIPDAGAAWTSWHWRGNNDGSSLSFTSVARGRVSLALLSVVAIGCKSGLESVALLYEGYDIPRRMGWPERQESGRRLQTAHVAGVQQSGAARALAEGICERLKAHIKDIHIVDPQKVAELIDEKGMDDYLEIGKALKAEKVVGIDIESFGVLDGQTLFRGRSTVSIQVYDVAEKHVEWHKSPPQFEYPKIGSTPAADITEMEFRNRFVGILAEQIARFFYPHDRHDDYGDDALSIR